MELTSSIEEFQRLLNEAAKEANEKASTVVCALFSELATRVAGRTPVETGRTAMNWQVSKDYPGEEVDKNATGDQTSAIQAMVDKLGKLSFDPPDGIYWLYNNLDHVAILEFGLYQNDSGKVSGGFSIQAPQGMVRVSIEELVSEAETIVRRALEA